MIHSDSIKAISFALAKAQREIRTITKDRVNPHFKNKYATLDAIVEAVRGPLAAHELAVVQDAGEQIFSADGSLRGFVVESKLVHSSGEWIANRVAMPITKCDPQGVGSALTYGRRYGLSALLSLATDEDDDGNAGSQQPKQEAKPAPAPAPAPVRDEASEAVLRALLPKLHESRQSIWTDWLKKPRKTDALLKAIAQIEDEILAAEEATATT